MCANHCLQILEQTQSAYARVIAVTTLTRLTSRPICPLERQERLQIRNFALDFLANFMPQEHYVTSELTRLAVRLTKLGWFDQDDSESFVMRDAASRITMLFMVSVGRAA